jgi:uncharacterized protein (TIGR02246 family)
MKTIYPVVLCFLLMLLSSCSQNVNNPADIQAIKESSDAWDKAWNAGNAEELASLYIADAIAMGPNMSASIGRDAIRASNANHFDQFRDENHSVVKDVRVSGNLAVAWGTQEDKVTPKAGGNSVQDKSKWITVYERQKDGSWKILWEMYNSDLPVTPVAEPPKTQTRDAAVQSKQ